MISFADYETTSASAAEPAETTADAKDIAQGFNPWASAATTAIAELVKQTKELHQWAAGQISPARELAGAPAPSNAHPVSETQEFKNFLPQASTLPAEKAAGEDSAEADEPPVKSWPSQVIPSSQAQAEEEAENAGRSASPSAGRNFKNRFDSVRTRLNRPAQSTDELPELLDRAIALLESVSQHPALRDYGANKRKLEEIEQRLGFGTYPQ